MYYYHGLLRKMRVDEYEGVIGANPRLATSWKQLHPSNRRV